MLILLGNDIPENPGPFDNEISIFHLNIRSIRHELDYVEALTLGSSIVCITESHLDETFSSLALNDNYDKKLQSRSCIALSSYSYIQK
jgi:hypothetical protein